MITNNFQNYVDNLVCILETIDHHYNESYLSHLKVQNTLQKNSNCNQGKFIAFVASSRGHFLKLKP